MRMNTSVTVETRVLAPVEKTWRYFTEPEHIIKWNAASDDWHTPRAANDLRAGGKFAARMEARDGSEGFDFEGIYDDVVPQQKIAYTMSDGRKVVVMFAAKGEETKVTETFDTEDQNPLELQRAGWQATLDRFKQYVESH